MGRGLKGVGCLYVLLLALCRLGAFELAVFGVASGTSGAVKLLAQTKQSNFCHRTPAVRVWVYSHEYVNLYYNYFSLIL